MQKSKEEIEKVYLEIKFQLSQQADDIPEDLRKELDQNLQILHTVLYVMMPAIDDLTTALKELSFIKYPEFDDNSIPHLGELVSQVCAEVANEIVKNTNAFLTDIENNNACYIENEKQFQELVTFYATPLDESDDESPNATGTTSSRTINNEKKEFLSVIMKVLFRYFEESLNKLDEKGWKLIGISLGHQFLVYIKRCCVLMAGLAESIITENPGISYEDLETKLSQDVTVSPGDEWMLKL